VRYDFSVQRSSNLYEPGTHRRGALPRDGGVDENWGSVVSEIRIKDEYSTGLRGLDQFSHMIVVFHMHNSSFDPGEHLVRRPQGRQDFPLTGIFAQRAKHRPNPIGVTAVEIVSVEGSTVKVKGLDAIDETPVLDIKPYFNSFDRRNGTEPSWVSKIMAEYF
jgi:tRNA-Thr(GGU) m(6)t(6)A37 methyltransferase TsaA